MPNENIREATIGGITITKSVNRFIDGWNVAQFARAGELSQAGEVAGQTFSSSSQAASWAKNAQGAAIAAVANAIVQFSGLDQNSAKVASVFVNTAYLIYIIAFAWNPVTFALAAIAVAIGLTGDDVAVERIYWRGRVSIGFNERYPYKFSVRVKTVDSSIIKDIAPKIEESLRTRLIGNINAALTEIPRQDVEWVLNHVYRPKDVDLNVDLGSTADPPDSGEFGQKLGEEIKKVQEEIAKTAQELPQLHLLASLEGKQLVDEIIVDQATNIEFDVVGAWRRELESLSIKLMQRREYVRQLQMVANYILFVAAAKTVPDSSQDSDFFLSLADQQGRSFLSIEPDEFPRPSKYSKRTRTTVYGNTVQQHYRGELLRQGCSINDNGLVDCTVNLFSGMKPVNRNGQLIFEPDVSSTNATDRTFLPRLSPAEVNQLAEKAYVPPGRKKFSYRYIMALYMLKPVNDLVSDIPAEAVDYIVNNLQTPSVISLQANVVAGDTASQPSTFFQRSIRSPRVKSISVENYAPVVNAILQDIIDLYAVWRQGFAQEFKRRQRQEILESQLPQLRDDLVPIISNIARKYGNFPSPEAAAGDIARRTANIMRQNAEQAGEFLPYLRRHRATIVSSFGPQEYNRLVNQAESSYHRFITEYVGRVQRAVTADITGSNLDTGLAVSESTLSVLVEETWDRVQSNRPDIAREITKNDVRNRFLSYLNVGDGYDTPTPAPTSIPTPAPTPAPDGPMGPVQEGPAPSRQGTRGVPPELIILAGSAVFALSVASASKNSLEGS